MIKIVIEYLFIFLTGSIAGWVIEFFFRRFNGSTKRWINPGFLSGPFLPLYGTGVVILYLICGMEIDFWIKIFIFAFATTGVEYITGVFFLHFYNIRLWDYRDRKIHYKGIISPVFSFYWTVLSLVFYYVLYPYFYQQVGFIYDHLEMSLFIGILCGMIMVDVVNSFDLINRMKKITATFGDGKIAINYELLKEQLLERVEHATNQLESATEHFKIKSIKPSFLHPFRGDYNLKNQIIDHLDKMREEKSGLLRKHKKA